MTILFYCVCKSVKCDLTCSHCKTLHTRGKTERRNSCTEGQRCCVPPNATETGLLICSFFFSFCVYFKYKSCLQAKQVVHKGRNTRACEKEKKMENGETKKQAQRNETEKCKIRNMWQKMGKKRNKGVKYVHVEMYRHMSLYLTGVISFTTSWSVTQRMMWLIKHKALHTYLKIPR